MPTTAVSPSKTIWDAQTVDTKAPLPPTESKAVEPAADAKSTRPKTLVASSINNWIVLIGPVSGKTTKVLVTLKDKICNGLQNVSLTPDSSVVYYDQPTAHTFKYETGDEGLYCT